MDFLKNQEKTDEMIKKCHTTLRTMFAKEIIDFKIKTHECQLKCYQKFQKDNDLYKSELCSKECSLPLLGANVSISKLLSKVDKEHMECRNASESKDYLVNKNVYIKCFNSFKENLHSQIEEIKYIYEGFYKQF